MKNLLKEIRSTFGELPCWNSKFLQESGYPLHDESEFLETLCIGKTWVELDTAKLADIYFMPGLFLTPGGVAFLMPALMSASLLSPDSDVSMHAINTCSPNSQHESALNKWRRERMQIFDQRQLETIIQWLSFINLRDEEQQEWLPAGIAMNVFKTELTRKLESE